MQIFYKIVFDISCYYTFASFFLKFALGYEISSLSMSLFLLAGLLVVGSQKISSIGRGMALLSAVVPVLFRPWGNIDYALLEFFLPWVYFVLQTSCSQRPLWLPCGPCSFPSACALPLHYHASFRAP